MGTRYCLAGLAMLIASGGSAQTPAWDERAEIGPFDPSARLQFAPTLVDLDGDGDLDIWRTGLRGSYNETYWHENTGEEANPVFEERSQYLAPGVLHQSVALLQPGGQAGTFYAPSNPGNRLYWKPLNSTASEVYNGSGVTALLKPILAADLDGDGDTDLLFEDDWGDLHNFGYLINEGAPEPDAGGWTLLRRAGTTVAPDWASIPSDVLVADFDGDGADDVVSLKVRAIDRILLSRVGGDPFLQEVRVDGEFGDEALGAWDTDGDGAEEVFMAGKNSSGPVIYRISWHPGQDPPYDVSVFYQSSLGASASPGTHCSMDFADADGDGDQDALVYLSVSPPERDPNYEFRILRREGDGSYSTHADMTRPGWRLGDNVQFVDADLDGTLDILSTPDVRNSYGTTYHPQVEWNRGLRGVLVADYHIESLFSGEPVTPGKPALFTADLFNNAETAFEGVSVRVGGGSESVSCPDPLQFVTLGPGDSVAVVFPLMIDSRGECGDSFRVLVEIDGKPARGLKHSPFQGLLGDLLEGTDSAGENQLVILPDNGIDAVTRSVHLDALPNSRTTAAHVTVEVFHSRRGDLRVTAIHPDGAQAIVFDGMSGDETDNLIGKYVVPSFAGKAPAGTYQLVVLDKVAGQIGTLASWSVEVGHERDVCATPTIDDAPAPYISLANLNNTFWGERDVEPLLDAPSYWDGTETLGLSVSGDPGSTYGFWTTESALDPLPAGLWRLRYELDWVEIPLFRRPGMRARINTPLFESVSIGETLQLPGSTGAAPPFIDVYWRSNGIDPLVANFDLISVDPAFAGGLTLLAIRPERVGSAEGTPLPDVDFVNHLDGDVWFPIAYEGIFDAPGFTADAAGGLTLTVADDPANTHGYWHPRTWQPAIPQGRYILRCHLSFDVPEGSLRPQVRVRAERSDFSYQSMGLAIQTVAGQPAPGHLDVVWDSDGTSDWGIAFDILAFDSAIGGSVTLTGIEVIPISD